MHQHRYQISDFEVEMWMRFQLMTPAEKQEIIKPQAEQESLIDATGGRPNSHVMKGHLETNALNLREFLNGRYDRAEN